MQEGEEDAASNASRFAVSGARNTEEVHVV